MNGGYIRVHRSLFEPRADFLDDLEKKAAWIDLLQMATHAPFRDLKRGEFRVSVRFLMRRWGWTQTKTWEFLGRLRKANMIRTVRTNTRGTVFTVVKYDDYQYSDDARRTPETDDGRTRSEHLANKNKETDAPTKVVKKGSLEPVSSQPSKRTRQATSDGPAHVSKYLPDVN